MEVTSKVKVPVATGLEVLATVSIFCGFVALSWLPEVVTDKPPRLMLASARVDSRRALFSVCLVLASTSAIWFGRGRFTPLRFRLRCLGGWWYM